jgi:diguanylate cyclase (GGDEF)-like protein
VINDKLGEAMELIRPDQLNIVVASRDGNPDPAIDAALRMAGFRGHWVSLNLDGLRKAAEIKPSAIVLLGLGEDWTSWVLNFVEKNPEAPAVIAVGEEADLASSEEWLYDIVSPTAVGAALAHRLKRALVYEDMRRLCSERTHKLGLSRAQIGMISMIDVVTGLFNRRYFKKHLRESFASAKRYHRPLSCLLVRIENFPSLSDSLGKEPANDILDTIALALSTVIRQADIAARIEEDIFGFLLPETTAEGAQRLVQRLVARFKQTEFPHHANIGVEASFAELSDAQQEASDLLTEAMAKLPDRAVSAE